MRFFFTIFALTLSVSLTAQTATKPAFVAKHDFAVEEESTLERVFTSPPSSAKPQTWWHWMNGNVRREGITADLEAMQNAGISAFQLFNIGLELPFGGVPYLSEKWLELVHFSALEAERLGLKMGIHNSAGWSSSGGPWIRPEQAMQEVVYSQLALKGGQVFADTLPAPHVRLGYYEDIAILAFPTPSEAKYIDGLAYKSLSGKIRNHLSPEGREVTPGAIIRPEDIVDLTGKVSQDGLLEWNVPAGQWTVLRLGYTPIGVKNRPAMQGGLGLECDKMSASAIKYHWKYGLQPILEKLDTLVGNSLTNVLIDSYEVETTNWTAGFEHSFRSLRGYDCLRFLPTLAGFYVESGEVSERFLWDFRRTIGDLIAEHYYGTFRELCHQHGLTFSVEPYWGPFDNMQAGAKGDVVLCEFWSGGHPFFDSPKFVSSIAHLNGHQVAGAESFTGIGGWGDHPARLKVVGDKVWAQGINQFVFHSYVHQPWDVGPGLALSYHGLEFNRLNTWWKPAKAYLDYITRSQALLQAGRSVNDVLVFVGSASPNSTFLLPEIQEAGYDYDLAGVNDLGQLSVADGIICTPSGGRYQVLVLPPNSWMQPETLSKLAKLAEKGASIIGPKPLKSPSLRNYPQCDTAVSELAEHLWGRQLIKDISLVNYLAQCALAPAVDFSAADRADLSFACRRTDEADVFFLANARSEFRQEALRFRSSRGRPEFWDAQSGTIRPATVWQTHEDGTTSLPVTLEAEASVFVVFRSLPEGDHLTEVQFEATGSSAEAVASLSPLPGLEIVKAEYGTFLQAGLVDITQKVRKAVRGNQLSFRVSRRFCDCDPAMGYKKNLRLEYQIGGEVHQIVARELEQINIVAPPGKGPLVIRKAVFGKFLPETKGIPDYFAPLDFTDKIRKLIAGGTYRIPVDEALLGGQKVVGNQPALNVLYTSEGEEYQVTIPHGRVLNLAQVGPRPSLVTDEQTDYLITPVPLRYTYVRKSDLIAHREVREIPAAVSITGPWTVTQQKNSGDTLRQYVVHQTPDLWNESSDDRIRHFSGTAHYRTVVEIPDSLLKPDYEFELDLGSVWVIAEVLVNGKSAGTAWKSPFRLPVTDLLQSGSNDLTVRITNLWPNQLIGDEQIAPDYAVGPKGLLEWPEWLANPAGRAGRRTTFATWKHWGKADSLLPSGLSGPVKINVYRKVKLE